MFRRKFKNNIKNEIMSNERDYKIFNEFVKIIINLNDKLYKRVMRKHYNQSRSKTEFIYVSIAKYTKPRKSTFYTRNSEYIELALMKLDMIQRCKKRI